MDDLKELKLPNDRSSRELPRRRLGAGSFDRHDFTEAEAKHQTRVETFRAVREQCPFLWDRQQRCLRHDWLEVTGKGDPTLRLLLDEHALKSGHGRYIGVNGPDPENRNQAQAEADARALLHENAALYADVAGLVSWHFGRLEDLLTDCAPYENVGVLVVDGWNSIGNRSIADSYHVLFAFAREQARRLGQCLLVVNLVCRGSADFPVEEALQQWRATLGRFCGMGAPYPEELLCKYQNKTQGWPMVLARIRF